jgi:hypothetical protein
VPGENTNNLTDCLIDVAVSDPAGLPVALGVPFPQGVIRDAAALALSQPDGRQIPADARALTRWPDGSTRWALVAFQAKQSGAHRVTAASAMSQPTETVRLIRHTSGAVELDNGKVSLRLEPTGAGPISGLCAFGRDVVNDASHLQFRIDDATSLSQPADQPRTVSVLESSSLRARVRVAGAHFNAHGQRLLHYHLDVELWVGCPAVRLDYQFFHLEPGRPTLSIAPRDVAPRQASAPSRAGTCSRSTTARSRSRARSCAPSRSRSWPTLPATRRTRGAPRCSARRWTARTTSARSCATWRRGSASSARAWCVRVDA